MHGCAAPVLAGDALVLQRELAIVAGAVWSVPALTCSQARPYILEPIPVRCHRLTAIPWPCRTFVLNRERAVDYLNMLERIYVFDGFAGWDPEVCAHTQILLKHGIAGVPRCVCDREVHRCNVACVSSMGTYAPLSCCRVVGPTWHV